MDRRKNSAVYEPKEEEYISLAEQQIHKYDISHEKFGALQWPTPSGSRSKVLW